MRETYTATSHGGVIVSGSGNVFIGDNTHGGAMTSYAPVEEEEEEQKQVFAKSASAPAKTVQPGTKTEPVSSFGKVAVLASIPASGAAANTIALGQLSGEVPAALGAWSYTSAMQALGFYVLAFWPTQMGDGSLYTDEQLQSLEAAATRVRFHFWTDEQNQTHISGTHIDPKRVNDEVDVITATRQGDRLVAELPGGVSLTWLPAHQGDIRDASTYYPATDRSLVDHILVNPIDTGVQSEMEVYPAEDTDYDDCIIVFPTDTGYAPIYIVYSKPPAHVLQVGLYGDLSKYALNGNHRDHMPSQAAVKQYLENNEIDSFTYGQDVIKKSMKRVAAVVIPAKAHQKYSETYGGRNNPSQITRDAQDLRKATDNNFDALKPYLSEYGFSDSELESAREKLHQLNEQEGWYEK